MQTQDSQNIIARYLLDAGKHSGFAAQPGSVSILREQKLAQSTIYLVSYITAEQHKLYACIILRPSETGSLAFSNFMTMGGFPIADLSQKQPPELAYARQSYSSDPRNSFVAFAVMQNEPQVIAIRLSDNHGYVATMPLENGTVLFLTPPSLHEPLYVDMLDHENNVVLQKTIDVMKRR